MGKVVADISVSMDGFITGPNPDVEQSLGEGIDRLHEWMYDLAAFRQPHGLEGGNTNRDSEVFEEAFEAPGTMIMGRSMFDVGEGPWGGNPPFHKPVFVLSHGPRETLVKEGGTSFTFITDGVGSALDQARAAAGAKDVGIAGGANVIQQFIKAGLLDEIQIHLAPVLLGGGIRLFEHIAEQVHLERTRLIESPAVTHLKFRIVK